MPKAEMRLAEAYRRREEIRRSGKAIYFRTDTADKLYPLEFLEKPHRKPNWYMVTLKRAEGHSSAFSLSGDVMVLVE